MKCLTFAALLTVALSSYIRPCEEYPVSSYAPVPTTESNLISTPAFYENVTVFGSEGEKAVPRGNNIVLSTADNESGTVSAVGGHVAVGFSGPGLAVGLGIELRERSAALSEVAMLPKQSK